MLSVTMFRRNVLRVHLNGKVPSRSRTVRCHIRASVPRCQHFSSSGPATSSSPAGLTWNQIAFWAAVSMLAGVTIGKLLWESPSGHAHHRWEPHGPRGAQQKLGLKRDMYANNKTMLKAVEEIRSSLGEAAVSQDQGDLDSHGYSETSSCNTTARPVAIVRPKSTEEVSRIAEICSKHKVPMVPYGAGSSVEGNFSSPYSGICIDLSAMDAIIQFHPEDMDVVVQAGVNWVDLNTEIEDSGLFLPLDPSPTAMIGGMISTNCSGTNAMRYGTMKDYVISLTVVLADGTVVKTRNRPRKTSAGYNLNGLFTGSEGTLGIITEATLKLATIPTNFSVATATFGTVKAAAAAAAQMIQNGIPLAALELMDGQQMKVINKNGGAGGRIWTELPTLFIKFSGSANTVKDSLSSARSLAKAYGCKTFDQASTSDEMDSLWSARKQALLASLAGRPEGTQLKSTDVAVPLSRMAEIIDSSSERAGKLGIFNSVLGHVGDGNFHQILIYHPDKAEEREAVEKCVDTMMIEALAMGGTISGEHGIGLGKKVISSLSDDRLVYDADTVITKHCLLKELGPSAMGVMKAMKDTLDPHWLLNPGKVFDE